MKKGKSPIGINEANQATFSGLSQDGFICRRCISPLECFFKLFFSFKTLKTIENSNRQIQRLCADAANEFIRLISLINSYLAFSFFHFFYNKVFAIRCNYSFNL